MSANRICIGVDNGHYAHKAYDHVGQSSLTPTRVKIGEDAMVSMMGDTRQKNRAFVTVAEGSNVTFSCGKFRTMEPIDPMTFPESPLSRVVLHNALANHMGGKYLGAPGLTVCTGIPLGRYFKDNGEKDVQLVSSIERNLSLPVHHKDLKADYSLNVSVKPQTYVAWYAYIMQEERDKSDPSKTKPIVDKEKTRHSMAIVDVGGGTTDICVFADSSMDRSMSGSIFVGANTIRENLTAAIKNRFDMDSIGVSSIDEALEKKQIFLDGKYHNIDDLYLEVHSAASQSLIGFLTKKLGKDAQKELREVRLIGGGASDFAAAIKAAIPRSELVENPQFENAKGMYLLTRHLSR